MFLCYLFLPDLQTAWRAACLCEFNVILRRCSAANLAEFFLLRFVDLFLLAFVRRASICGVAHRKITVAKKSVRIFINNLYLACFNNDVA